MDNNNNSNFMDSRTLIAIVLAALVWFGWQTYLGKKYPSVQKAPEAVTETKTAGATTETPTTTSAAEVGQGETPKTPAPMAQPEKTTAYENTLVSYQISSHGMGLKDVTLKNHLDRAHNPMKLGLSDQHTLFETQVSGTHQPLNFNIEKKSDNVFEGTADWNGAKITRTLTINPDTDAITNLVLVQNAPKDFPGLSVFIPEKAVASAGGGLFNPSYEHQEFIISHSGTDERINNSNAKEEIKKDFAGVSMVAIGNQYFTSALVDKSDLIPEVKLHGGKDQAELLTQVDYKPAGGKNSLELNWIAYTGPKSYANLDAIDHNLVKIVDLGFFGQIGHVLLVIMKWFYSVFGNWGVAIILLTLMVRTLVLPLNITTYKSTRKMQKLQPLIASLRERYKDDPAALNRETMALWKENKVNPLGGCLPMLLQLPIFFALYRVLGQSIELYQAPFFGWIHDLSVKDPYYVLPVLMGICMFIQQKTTPTAMDPNQAKIMQFIPVVFAFMMLSLPSGLTLYIFINTLSGIILQQIFMRDRSTAVTAKEAKA